MCHQEVVYCTALGLQNALLLSADTHRHANAEFLKVSVSDYVTIWLATHQYVPRIRQNLLSPCRHVQLPPLRNRTLRRIRSQAAEFSTSSIPQHCSETLGTIPRGALV